MGNILTHPGIGQAALLERLAIEGFTEITVRTTERRNLGNFAIDQQIAGNHTVFFTESGHGSAIKQLFEHLIQPAIGQK